MSALPKGFAAAAFAYENQENPAYTDDPRWTAYEGWSSEQTDAEFADHVRDYFDLKLTATGTVKSEIGIFGGTKRIATVEVDQWSAFKDWQFDNRYPGAK